MIQLPSFARGTPGTLLDSEHAQTVKRFVEAFNRPQLVLGERNAVFVSDSNVVISISRAELMGLVRAAFDANTAGISDAIYDAAYQAAIDAAGSGEFDAVINQIITDRDLVGWSEVTAQTVSTCDPGGTLDFLVVV